MAVAVDDARLSMRTWRSLCPLAGGLGAEGIAQRRSPAAPCEIFCTDTDTGTDTDIDADANPYPPWHLYSCTPCPSHAVRAMSAARLISAGALTCSYSDLPLMLVSLALTALHFTKPLVLAMASPSLVEMLWTAAAPRDRLGSAAEPPPRPTANTSSRKPHTHSHLCIH